MTFREILEFRRSTRIYDGTPVPNEIIQSAVDDATLAPNSSNLQLWEFYHVVNSKKKKALIEACLDQSAAKTAPNFVVIVTRRDKWKDRCKTNLEAVKKAERPSQTGIDYYSKLLPFIYTDFFGILGFFKKILVTIIGWKKPMYKEVSATDIRVTAHKSVGLGAQTFMLSMASKGYDTCPMEGFDSKRVRKILNLPRKAEINMVISCGKRKPEGIWGERFRLPLEDVFFEV